MLSRAAENIYWMARYLERAENTARLVAVHSEFRLDRPDRSGFFWEPVLSITGTLEDFDARGLPRTEREATNFLLSDPQNPSSLLSSCSYARENIRTLMEMLPRESWEAVNGLHAAAARPGVGAPQMRDVHLREIIGRSQAMAGLFSGAMNDDAGYAVLRLGRTIERGSFTVQVLENALARIGDGVGDMLSLQAAEWVGVLKSLTAYQMYRRSLRGPVTRLGVSRFLVFSQVFPRALVHCLGGIGQALGRLPDSGAAAATAARLSAELAAAETAGADADRIAGLLASARSDLSALHQAVCETYFIAPTRVAPPAPASRTQAQGA
ncbi:Uncharacterized conserved protein, Alpha-E superfamily [Paracoccus chinensis]|uniref:Uncharacterized conserved protein, Alpha-E superfamily n=2 Tax=Paracoccus chinensis TaxID=525640 RepID=A0A1G9LM52_9RHOB|nr:Uncharacterized conserved protein, Alpha-E superfamily [Paracoccus chinensis]